MNKEERITAREVAAKMIGEHCDQCEDTGWKTTYYYRYRNGSKDYHRVPTRDACECRHNHRSIFYLSFIA